MTDIASTATAMDTVLAYHDAWAAKDVETTLSFVADDIVCDSPSGRLEGAAAFRGFIEGFNHVFTGAEVINAFGDERTVIVVAETHALPVPSQMAATQFTVTDAKITHALFMFDRLPYEEARAAAEAGAVV